VTGKDRRGTGPGTDLDTGVLRPDPMVLAEEALIPEHNLVDPPPTRFTHQLTEDEPYRYDRPGRRRSEPDGVLPAGTAVVLMIEGERRSRVVDGEGRYVEVGTANLRELPSR
jgi:hypothetical protein